VVEVVAACMQGAVECILDQKPRSEFVGRRIGPDLHAVYLGAISGAPFVILLHVLSLYMKEKTMKPVRAASQNIASVCVCCACVIAH
jgi:hypothetical protein